MGSFKEDLERAIHQSLEANPNLNYTIPSLIEEEEEEEEDEPERKSMVYLEEMKSVDVITPSPQDEIAPSTLVRNRERLKNRYKYSKRLKKRKHMEVYDITPRFKPEEIEVASILQQMQIYHDRIEDLKKTQNPNLDSKWQLVSSVKDCETRIHMEVDNSQRTLITYTRRCKNNVPKNPPRRFFGSDSYEVVESSKPERKPRKKIEIDDTKETLDTMIRWKEKIEKMNNPPEKMFMHDSEALGRCSKPMRKQVMESDVKVDQCRLMLGKEQVKKMMEEVLGKIDNPGTKGRQVSVYGPDGRIFQMMFKMWGVKKTPVLASSEWTKFVKIYGIDTPRDFLIIWMFRHQETDKLCFAIDFDRFGVDAKLSKRILKEAGF